MDNTKINEILERLDSCNDDRLKMLIKELLSEVNILNKRVYKDELTQVYNRKILSENIKYDVLAMCDIDNFKEINDKYGHSIGDKILVEISKTMSSTIRSNDIICRYGGDEFTILFRECKLSDIVKRIEYLKNKIELLNEENINITVSFGLSEYQEGKTIKDAIIEADQALYESKKTGKNKVTIFNNNNKVKKK